jgi:hypothetical protein
MSRHDSTVSIIYGGDNATRIAQTEIYIKNISKENIPSVVTVDAETVSIGIGEVKKVISQLQHTSLGSSTRIFLFKDAHRLTVPAQNALLKVLEEMPRGSHILFEVENIYSLLVTIQSRAHIIPVTQSGALSFGELFENGAVLGFEDLRRLPLDSLIQLSAEFSKTRQSTKLAITYLLSLVKIVLETRSNISMGISTSQCYSYGEFLLQCSEWVADTTVNTRLVVENCLLGFYNLFRDK